MLTSLGCMNGSPWPIRDPHSRWYLSPKDYRFIKFPPWTQGMLYLFTPTVARHLYELSFSTPYIMTGKCLFIGRVKVQAIF